MNLKKIASIISIMLVLLMILSMLASCNVTGDGSGSESISGSESESESIGETGNGSEENDETGDLTPPETDLSGDGEEGDLGGSDVVYPGDTPVEESPENPSTSLYFKSLEKYKKSDGGLANLGCKAITILAKYNVGVEYDIKAVKNSTTKMFYLCLPSRADLSKVTFTVTHYNGSVSGPYTANFADTAVSDNERVIGNTSTYTIEAYKSDRPALMLQVDEQYGTVSAMNSSSNHSVYAYGDMLITVTEEMAKANGWTTRYESSDIDPDMYCSMEMRGRGNATWNYAKKGYQFELEMDMDLLGLGRSDTFVLLANYNDATLMRNQLALWFGQQMGCDFAVKFCQVDFYLNGEYMGLYMLAEKCDIGENRIEIDKNEDFLYEINQKYNEYGEFGFLSYYDSLGKIRLHNGDATKGAEIFRKADSAAYGSNEAEFLKYFDLESWAKAFIMQQITMNHDAYWGSFYFYYDHTDGKMHACTPWDFDYSMGVSWASKNSLSAKDAAENPRKYDVRSHYLIEGMLKFDSFKKAIVDVYYSQGVSSIIKSFPEMIDFWQEENRIAAEINAKAAPVRWYPDYEGGKYPKDVTNYDEAVEYLKWIIEPRIEWFDEQMKGYLDEVGLEPTELQGSGTKDDPYVIDDTSDIFSMVSAMQGGETFKDKYFVQTKDIDAVTLFFGLTIDSVFDGEYDGRGHSIKINLAGAEECLFPNVKGIVMNLVVIGKVKNTYHAAGIARAVSDGGKIINCISCVDLEGRLIGGIVANLEAGGKVFGCAFTGTATGSASNAKLGSVAAAKSSSTTAAIVSCYSLEELKWAGSENGCTFFKSAELDKMAESINASLSAVAENSGIDVSVLCKVVVENGKLELEDK